MKLAGWPVRYVDDTFYERNWYIGVPDDQWYHCTPWDNGGALDGFNPSEWLPQARAEMLGEGLLDLVTSASGFTQAVSDNGDHIYKGTLTVATLADHNLGLSGAPFAGAPMKGLAATARDPQANEEFRTAIGDIPVTMEVTVGADGLVKAATLAYTTGGEEMRIKPNGRLGAAPYESHFIFGLTYSQFGSAPAIELPDAAQTVTTDKPAGYHVKWRDPGSPRDDSEDRCARRSPGPLCGSRSHAGRLRGGGDPAAPLRRARRFRQVYCRAMAIRKSASVSGISSPDTSTVTRLIVPVKWNAP